MPVFIQIDVGPQEVATETAARLEPRPLRPMLAEIGEEMRLSTDERFVREEAPSGEPWAPLSPATYEWGFRKRYRESIDAGNTQVYKTVGGRRVETAKFARYKANKKILQEKGQRGGLRGDVNWQVVPGGVRLGVSKIYGRAQQKGLGERSSVRTRRTFGAIPARPFLGASERDRSVIAGIIRKYTAGSP